MRELILQDIRVDRPIGQDVTYAYKIRYWRNEDGTFTQEYGGLPDWHEYSGYDRLDMTKCLVLNGQEVEALKNGLREVDEHNERAMLRLYVDLKGIYQHRGVV